MCAKTFIFRYIIFYIHTAVKGAHTRRWIGVKLLCDSTFTTFALRTIAFETWKILVVSVDEWSIKYILLCFSVDKMELIRFFLSWSSFGACVIVFSSDNDLHSRRVLFRMVPPADRSASKRGESEWLRYIICMWAQFHVNVLIYTIKKLFSINAERGKRSKFSKVILKAFVFKMFPAWRHVNLFSLAHISWADMGQPCGNSYSSFSCGSITGEPLLITTTIMHRALRSAQQTTTGTRTNRGLSASLINKQQNFKASGLSYEPPTLKYSVSVSTSLRRSA